MSFRTRRYTDTIMAMRRSFTSTRRPTTIPDTPAITPVRLGTTSLRTHSSVVVADSRLGRMSEFSHCSKEVAAES